jgi:hypothetical protein
MTILTYEGQTVEQRDSDQYVNLGSLCRTHGKKLKDWLKTTQSKDYLKALAETLTEQGGIIIPPDGLVVSTTNNIGGDASTWGHPLVAIEIARWLSPKFGVWCNIHIRTLVETGETHLTASDITDQLKALREEVQALKPANKKEPPKKIKAYSRDPRNPWVDWHGEGEFPDEETLRHICWLIELKKGREECLKRQEKRLRPLN